MEHLSEFVFISMMGNLTLAHRDAYMSHLRTGIETDTLTALRTAPLHITTLFPDAVIKRVEDIAHFKTKGHSSSARSKGRYHPCERSDRRSDNRTDTRLDKPAWKTIGKRQFKKGKGQTTSYSS